jgi:hypothetical protein
VYTGGRCPTLDDDVNKDGFIDINEAEKVLGKILIPLDSDITTQNSGSRFFPLGDLSGYYHYERITNFERFLDDLQAPDQNLEDDVVKIPDGRGLVIAGKTFMVQGVAETVDLPESVGTKEKKRAFQTLPVACGVFEKIITSPGQTYVENEIPGPMAEVIEGQDRPVEEEIPQSEGEDEQRPGTNTNESDHGNGPVSNGETGRSIESPSPELPDATNGPIHSESEPN